MGNVGSRRFPHLFTDDPLELVPLVYIAPDDLHGNDDDTAGSDAALVLLDPGSGGRAETRI